jgi:hypothetical protein
MIAMAVLETKEPTVHLEPMQWAMALGVGRGAIIQQANRAAISKSAAKTTSWVEQELQVGQMVATRVRRYKRRVLARAAQAGVVVALAVQMYQVMAALEEAAQLIWLFHRQGALQV